MLKLGLLGVVVLLGFVLSSFSSFNTLPTASAAAGINHTINFQGKLVNPDGTNVTNGSYSIVFSMYTVSSGGSNLWTETQTPTVTNGIFQVALGSSCPFNVANACNGSTPVDFNVDNLYLGVKVGADAEMTPRIIIGAVPQAFNSEKLGGLDKTGFIQNTTTQQASSNFNVSGAGVIGTTLTTPVLQSAAATALTITGNAASTWSTSAGNITLQAGSGTVSLGSTTTLSSSGALTVTGGTTLALNSTGTNAITLDSGTTGAVNIATGTGATKTIQIGNTGTSGITETINIGNTTGTSTAGILIGSLIGTSTTTLNGGTGTGTGDLVMQTAASGIINIGNNAVSGKVVNIGSVGATATTSTINVGTGAAVQTLTIGSANTNSTTTVQGGDGASGGISLNVTGTNNRGTIVQSTTTNSTAAFQVQNAAGTSNLLIADTTNSRIGLGVVPITTAGSGLLQVGAASSTTAAQGVSFGGDTAANLYRSANNTIKTDGSLNIQTSANSATAFQIQNAAGTTAVNVNTLSSPNLVANGSMEGSTNGWSAKGTSTLTADGSQSQFGTESLKTVTTTAAGDGATYTVPILASTQYAFSLYAKVAASSITDVSIGRQDISGTDVDCLTSQTLTTTWTRFTCTFTTGATITNSNLYIKKTGAAAETFFVDGVQLEPGATASTYNSGINNLQVESGTNIVLLNGNNPGVLNAWQQTPGALPAGLLEQSSVVANGYVYLIGGNNGSGVSQTTVYYAKLNADGSTGAWTTSASPLPSARKRHSSVVANGYVYVIGGDLSGTYQSTVYYAKFNADGSTSDWNTTTSLPFNTGLHSSVVANGYVYVMGGYTGSGTTAVYYAKLNADGTIGSWTTSANVLPIQDRLHSSVVANGYVYVIGGFDGVAGSATANVYYAKLNADGSTGAWTTSTNALPAARRQAGAVVANGYVYLIGGFDNATGYSTVYYAKLNANGSTSAWATNTNSLPAIRGSHSTVIANGYVYALGGSTNFTNAQSTAYYASTARIRASGVLDLVGLSGGSNLADPGSLGGTGSSGGELIAGNTNIIGALQVLGDAGFSQSLSVNNSLTVDGQASVGSGLNVTGSINGQNYSVGTITQSTTTITGSSTVFTAGMVGGILYYPDGTNTTVTGFTSATSITVASSRTIASASSYNLQWGGLSLNGGASNIQSTTNSVNALQILNSDGVQLFNVDTSTTPNLVTNSHFESNITGWTAKGSATLSRTTSEKYQGGAALQVAATAAIGDGVKYNYTFTNGTTYSLAFDIKLASGTWTNANLEVGRADNGSTDTPCTLSPGTNLVLNGWRRYSCTFTAGAQSATPYFYVKQLDAVSRTFYIDAAQLEINSSSTAFQLGTTSINGVINSPVALRNQTDSSTAFIVQNAAGSSLFTVDTQTSSTNSLGLFKASAGMSVSSLSAPGAPNVAVLGANNAVTYTYTVTARNSNGGETTASATGTTAIGSTTPNNRITWTPVVGAADYNIYRTVGGTGQGLIGTTTLTTFDDVNLTGSGASPTLNSSGYVGIGNTTPGTRLDVNGAITLRAVSGLPVSQAGQGILLYDTTANKFQTSENAGAYKTLCNTTDRGCGGGNVVVSAQTDGGAGTTTTIATAGTSYFLSQTTTDVTSDTRTFNITGVSNVEGTIICIVTQAVDSSALSTATLTVQINGAQVSTATQATNGNTTKENYTLGYINGAWRIVGLNSSTAQASPGSDTADFAEWIPYTGVRPQAGELLTIGDSSVSAKRSDQAYDRGLLGVVSTTPYQTAGADDGHSVIIALTGRAPVKVSLENGPILPGDYLTSSSVPGVAMKATKPGPTIGKALSAYDGTGEAMVTVQIQSGNADPRTQQEILQGDQRFDGNLSITGNVAIGGNLNVGGITSLGSLTVSGATTLDTLTVGTATITGNLTVQGLTTLASLRVEGGAQIGGDINLTSVGQSRGAVTKKFKASKDLRVGDVVIGDPVNDGQVTTTTLSSDTKVLGIALTDTLAGQDVTVAIGGSVQVKVAPTTSIANGDLLVSSSSEGAADKSTAPGVGAVLGKSLGRPDASGLVWILVTLN